MEMYGQVEIQVRSNENDELNIRSAVIQVCYKVIHELDGRVKGIATFIMLLFDILSENQISPSICIWKL